MTEGVGTGLCQCGCGASAGVWLENDSHQGRRKGEPKRYLAGHYRAKPARHLSSQGYIQVTDRTQYRPVPTSRGRRYEHDVIVEGVLGHALPPGAEVHHIDGNKSNNAKSNLVACQDRAYHFLLHRRANALRECGNPDARKCGYCHEWDDPSNLVIYASNSSARHTACESRYARERRARRALKRAGT